MDTTETKLKDGETIDKSTDHRSNMATLYISGQKEEKISSSEVTSNKTNTDSTTKPKQKKVNLMKNHFCLWRSHLTSQKYII